ncbi:hypothetical protein [Nocardia sp. NPDC005998]|uniref:hypothetical protein n=1 Tax=Nocardia sp. NPDC005998 TaxID=3156894 RepID=UPI0033A5BA7F
MLAQFVLFDGFDPLDVIAPFVVLDAGRLASDGWVTVESVSAEGARRVPGSISAISLDAAARLDPDRADLIVVPGAVGPLPEGPKDQWPDAKRCGTVRRNAGRTPAVAR